MRNLARPCPTWRIVRATIYLITALLSLILALPAQAQVDGPIYTVAIDGVISRYTVGYLRRTLHDAEAAQATVLIIRLGGQGAVLRDVRSLAADLAAARVPVVVYVAPAGTDAGAAGSWLLSAADLAVMAPDTRFGTATALIEPVADLSAQVRDLFFAEATRQLSDWNHSHGRNNSWVDRAVREGAIFSNEQAIALDPPAINIVARDEQDLLILLEGRQVTLADGSQVVLHTLGQPVRLLEPNLGEQLLLLLADPTVAFLLLVMAGIAIYAEFATPTVGVLAGIGAVLLISSLVGLLALPLNWLSFLGILLAFGIVAADLFLHSHGALTVFGLIVLVVSALTLFDAAQAPGVVVALWAIILVSLLIASFAAVGIYFVVRMRNQPVTTGQEGLVGRLAEVRKQLSPEGMVFVDGALWRAVCENGEAEIGEYVRVTGIYELRLTVRRQDDSQPV